MMFEQDIPTNGAICPPRGASAGEEIYIYDREDVVQECTHGVFNGATTFGHNWSGPPGPGPGIDDYVAVDIPGGANAGVHFYHTDGLGSITDMTTQAGSTLNTRYEYMPFGKATVDGTFNTLASVNPYGYTGRRLDGESGLMYYRSRFYGPEVRRFVGEDRWDGIKYRPHTYTNKYVYCGNNPINYTDPSGADDSSGGFSALFLLALAALVVVFLYFSKMCVDSLNDNVFNKKPKNPQGGPPSDQMNLEDYPWWNDLPESSDLKKTNDRVNRLGLKKIMDEDPVNNPDPYSEMLLKNSGDWWKKEPPPWNELWPDYDPDKYK